MKRESPRTINPRPRPGPKAASVAHDGDWEAAVKKALDKKRPAEGWPNMEKRPRKK